MTDRQTREVKIRVAKAERSRTNNHAVINLHPHVNENLPSLVTVRPSSIFCTMIELNYSWCRGINWNGLRSCGKFYTLWLCSSSVKEYLLKSVYVSLPTCSKQENWSVDLLSATDVGWRRFAMDEIITSSRPLWSTITPVMAGQYSSIVMSIIIDRYSHQCDRVYKADLWRPQVTAQLHHNLWCGYGVVVVSVLRFERLNNIHVGLAFRNVTVMA